MATSKANLNSDQYVRINIGLNPMILQSNRDQVRIVFADSRPALSNTAFHQLNGEDAPFFIRQPDTHVWALALTDTASLTVTEMVGPEAGENPIDTITELAMMLLEQLSMVTSNQDEQVKQLQMLNLRLEEAFETRLDEGYLNDPSD